jgi:nitroreductase
VDQMPFDLSVTDELLTTTRAVRRRLDFARAVPDAVLRECVGIAQQAPTGGNSQGWRFVIVRDPAKRTAIAELYADVARDRLRAARATASTDQTERVYDSALWLADRLADVPVHVIPCLTDPLPPPDDQAATASFYANIMPAAWSFMLALRSRGLGSTWTTFSLRRATEVAQLLGIPDGVTQVGLLPVAYYTGAEFSPAQRPPPDSVIWWDVGPVADSSA